MYLGNRYDDPPPPPDGCRNLILLLASMWAAIALMVWLMTSRH